MTVTFLSHPSSLSPESGANDSEISDTQTQLFEDVTSCYYLAQQLVPMDTRWRLVARPFSVSLYVQPECSSTSDCRKLHGHFNTVFLFFFCSFREQKEKCIIIWKTSNLYAGEKIFTIYIYKKKTDVVKPHENMPILTLNLKRVFWVWPPHKVAS